MITEGRVTFRNREEKAAYLERMAQEDATSAEVVSWSRQFAGIEDDEKKAAAILEFCQICIEYRNDPGVEVLDSAAVALLRGYGDCDVKARACVALMRACGLTAETDPVFVGVSGFPHIRAKVFLRGRWFVIDPCVVNSTIGNLPRVKQRTEWR